MRDSVLLTTLVPRFEGRERTPAGIPFDPYRSPPGGEGVPEERVVPSTSGPRRPRTDSSRGSGTRVRPGRTSGRTGPDPLEPGDERVVIYRGVAGTVPSVWGSHQDGGGRDVSHNNLHPALPQTIPDSGGPSGERRPRGRDRRATHTTHPPRRRSGKLPGSSLEVDSRASDPSLPLSPSLSPYACGRRALRPRRSTGDAPSATAGREPRRGRGHDPRRPPPVPGSQTRDDRGGAGAPGLLQGRGGPRPTPRGAAPPRGPRGWARGAGAVSDRKGPAPETSSETRQGCRRRKWRTWSRTRKGYRAGPGVAAPTRALEPRRVSAAAGAPWPAEGAAEGAAEERRAAGKREEPEAEPEPEGRASPAPRAVPAPRRAPAPARRPRPAPAPWTAAEGLRPQARARRLEAVGRGRRAGPGTEAGGARAGPCGGGVHARRASPVRRRLRPPDPDDRPDPCAGGPHVTLGAAPPPRPDSGLSEGLRRPGRPLPRLRRPPAPGPRLSGPAVTGTSAGRSDSPQGPGPKGTLHSSLTLLLRGLLLKPQSLGRGGWGFVGGRGEAFITPAVSKGVGVRLRTGVPSGVVGVTPSS